MRWRLLAFAFLSVGYERTATAEPTSPTFAEAAETFYARAADAPACADGPLPARIQCLIDARYDLDAEARALARSLFERTGSLAGVEPESTMDGGFRGKIHIVPELPVANHRRQLAWVEAAMRDIDSLFADLRARGAASAGASGPPKYRWREIELHFFRSVGRTTPSAYARGWSVAYNVSGSLHTSADAVRETLFHEIFHLNDENHRDWSPRTLGRDYDAIVKKCGRSVSCLAPYAPGDTKVRGGTYYAFQPDNGLSVREYAAELALRWYREHRAIVRGEKLRQPAFKCGPPENARAWKAIVDEFFLVDLVPACS
jgi:hypothetical protein